MSTLTTSSRSLPFIEDAPVRQVRRTARSGHTRRDTPRLYSWWQNSDDHAGQALLRQRRLQDVLLNHLLHATFPTWPGGDGLSVEEVLLSYHEALAAGQVPGLDELLQRHPDLNGELCAFFK
jgi:hypothetical protein